ncbi:MAG: hypothetical protein IKV97_02945 [Clostridia bacterium]|nr:hypothetical protein [Clostridia bacterium]
MTSFADDNRRILNTKNRQYNRTTESLRTYSDARQTAGVSAQEETFGTAVRRVARRAKRAADLKNARFAVENSKTIRDTLAAGVNKVDYSYEEYAVEENNFPVSLAAIAVAVTVVAVFLLMNYSQITKYNKNINELQETMAEYNAQIAEHDILLNKKTDHSVIEKYALENGMVTSEQVSSKYVTMSDSYKIIKSNESETEVSVSTVMSGVIKLFGEVMGKE